MQHQIVTCVPGRILSRISEGISEKILEGLPGDFLGGIPTGLLGGIIKEGIKFEKNSGKRQNYILG